MGNLSALFVKSVKNPGTYQDGEGLMLLVKPTGTRSWQVRVQVDGKRRDFGLGSAFTVSLADARTKAAAIRATYKTGVDPVAKRRAEKRAQQEIPTFKQATESAHAELLTGWRNGKHKRDWASSLQSYAYPHIGDVRIDQLTPAMVRDLLLDIWLAIPVTAKRVRQRIKAVVDWAAAKGYCKPLDLSGVIKGLPRQPKRDAHFAAMPYSDVPGFLESLANAPESIGRTALQFAILTAARSGEVRGAVWGEFDLDNAIWSIPGERMKAGRPHIVPLSSAAMALLKVAARIGCDPAKPVFPGVRGGALSDMTLSKIMRDMKLPFTVHGFRSSFKDWACECTSYPDAVSEAALAHADNDRTRAAYRRTDFLEKRRELMATWGSYCSGAGVSPVRLVASQ